MTLSHIEQARYEHRHFASALDAIRLDRDLNDEAETRKIAERHQRPTERMAELKEGHFEAQRAGQRQRQTKAYGPRIPAHADRAEEAAIRSSYREALTSVVSIDREAAGRLMELATATGDHLLGRAVAVVAFHQGWNDVADVDATGGDDPEWGNDVNALVASGPTATQRTGELMEFSAPLPPELASLPQPDLNAAMAGVSRERSTTEVAPVNVTPAFST